MFIRSQKSEQRACVYLERIKIRCTHTYISNILILFLPEQFSRMILVLIMLAPSINEVINEVIASFPLATATLHHKNQS